MVRWLVLSTNVLFIFFLVSAQAVSGNTGGYDVVPVSPDTLTGIPHDPVPISFFELSPRVMAIGIILSFFPLLLFPVELIFFLKIFSVLGYRRIAGDPVFRNGNRATIHTVIREHPGITFPDLSRLTGIKRAAVRYHLAVLSVREKITRIHCLNMTCYFENNGQFSDFEKQMIIHLRNRTARTILEMLVISPGISRRDIAEKIGIAGSSVTWYTDRLSCGGIITVTKVGRDTCYAPTYEAQEFLRNVYLKYLFTEPGRI